MSYESTTTSLSELLPSIVAEALFVASERSIMRGLVRNYTLGQSQGKTVTVPIYPIQTAKALTEGTDIANVNTYDVSINTSSATLTVAEVGIMTKVTDLARLSSASNVIADVGRLFGEAIARKMDQDLTAKFSSFTTNVLGNVTAAGDTITVADIFKGVAKLTSAGVPLTDVSCVLHPRVAYDLKAALTTTGAVAYTAGAFGDVANEAMRMGFVGMLAGIPIYETSNIVSQSGSDDFTGAIFHRDALGLAMMRDIQIETQRDASLRADELVATAIYGTGVLYEGYGSALGFDSTI
jgi:N4-gp56 family major capsid protein